MTRFIEAPSIFLHAVRVEPGKSYFVSRTASSSIFPSTDTRCKKTRVIGHGKSMVSTILPLLTMARSVTAVSWIIWLSTLWQTCLCGDGTSAARTDCAASPTQNTASRTVVLTACRHMMSTLRGDIPSYLLQEVSLEASYWRRQSRIRHQLWQIFLVIQIDLSQHRHIVTQQMPLCNPEFTHRRSRTDHGQS